MIQVSLKVIGFLSVLFVVVMMGGLLTWIIFLPLITKDYALPHPIPIPDIPKDLRTLPALAQTTCQGPIVPERTSVTDQHFINVWRKPGGFPNRPDDSAGYPPYSMTGGQRGRILHCTQVKAQEYAWSEFDGEFYVRVQVVPSPLPDRDREFWRWIASEQASGWVRNRLLDFSQ